MGKQSFDGAKQLSYLHLKGGIMEGGRLEQKAPLLQSKDPFDFEDNAFEVLI